MTRRSALLVDEEKRWIRRPRDLFLSAITLLSILGVILLAVYGYSTTLAVTRDVRTATDGIVSSIVFVPINVVEGLVGFFLPIAVIGDVVWHRRWRTLGTSVLAVGAAVGIAYGILWLFTRYFPLLPITGQLSETLSEQSYLAFMPYVAVLAALITVASSGTPVRSTAWAWPLLTVVLILSILQGNQTLPGALITVCIGIFCGLLSRYVVGDTPDRATGIDLVRIVRRAGIDAELIVRIDPLATDVRPRAWVASTGTEVGYSDRFSVRQISRILQKAGENFENPNASDEGPLSRSNELAYTTTQPNGPLTLADDVDVDGLRARILRDFHPPVTDAAARNYVIIGMDGHAYHASFFDADREIVGMLRSTWNRFVLTTTAQRNEPTIAAQAEHFALMELTLGHEAITPERNVRIAGADNSYAIILPIDEARALSSMTAEEITDAMLNDLWETLLAAHRKGITHGNIHAGLTAVTDSGLTLFHWGNGQLAASEMERRIDMAQAMAMLSVAVGKERAVASASRCLEDEQIISLAPILQRAIIPSATSARFNGKKELEELRDELTEEVPEVAEVEATQLYRFSPKTAITATIGVLAVIILFGSINFEDLRATLTQANPLWMLTAFILGLFTYIGAAMTLRAYTAENMRLRDATLVQVAASLVTLVAPAGIGPAALNLRFLQKRQVATPVALATVTLVQVAQFITTIFVLIVLSLVTGEVGSLTLPSASVVVAIAVGIAAIAALFLIAPLRRWVGGKVRPSIEQVWPRIVWLATHPSRIFYGFLGSVIQTIAFVACFGGSLAAFGYTLPVVTLSITYLVSNSVGSIVPSPGGIGPVEAALTGGLTLAGVPASIALSTAVLYRLLTFWGRVPLGWLALRFVSKREII